MKPGDLVVLRENSKYSGIVIGREIMKDCYKVTKCQEPIFLVQVLWGTDQIPIGEVGNLGTGAGCLKKIIEDLLEVKIHADR